MLKQKQGGVVGLPQIRAHLAFSMHSHSLACRTEARKFANVRWFWDLLSWLKVRYIWFPKSPFILTGQLDTKLITMASSNLVLRFRHNAMAWLSSFTSLLLLVLTVLYALRSYSMSSYQSIRSSSSRTILVLRVLSELTSILMVIMLALTMESVKWRFITRKQGQQLKTFLTLVPGTSILGLL